MIRQGIVRKRNRQVGKRKRRVSVRKRYHQRAKIAKTQRVKVVKTIGDHDTVAAAAAARAETHRRGVPGFGIDENR